MNSDSSRLYFDSCCFIDLAARELGYLHDQDREDHLWYCRAFLDAARAKELEVATSTLAVAECTVVRDEKRQPIMTDEVKRLFRGLLLSGRPVIPIQPTPRIVEFARDLKWQHGLSIKPMDALHLATAIDRGCGAFVTSDGPLIGFKSALEQFGITVCKADAISSLLPDKYRQLPLSKKSGKKAA